MTITVGFHFCHWWPEYRIRQQLDCIKSIAALGAVPVALQFTDDPIDLLPVRIAKVLTRRITSDYTAHPVSVEMCDWLAAAGSDFFIFGCSDVLWHPKCQTLFTGPAIGFQRHDIPEVPYEVWEQNRPAPIQSCHNGFIGFGFQPEWWRAHSSEFPPYVDGPCIDTDFDRIASRLAGNAYIRLRCTDHRPHEAFWHQGSPEAVHNYALRASRGL